MNPGIVLQARMGSARLRGKSLEPVGGRPLVEQCIRRLLASGVAPVVLATTTKSDDDVLAETGRQCGVLVFRGPSEDVLARYVACASEFGFDTIIRATADNPAVDIDAPARLLAAMTARGAEYVHEDGLPYGAAVEAVTRVALLRAALLAQDPFDCEHVTTFVRRRVDLFKVVTLPAPEALARPDVRLTVDTWGDLQQMRELYSTVGDLAPLTDFIHAWKGIEHRSVA